MTFENDIRFAASKLDLSALSGKNILVTGATGLIGSCVVKMLLEYPRIDYTVYASGRNNSRMNELFNEFSGNKHLLFLEHDILDPLDEKTDFHYMIHAASYASPSAFVSKPVDVIKANILGLSHLIDYGKEHNLLRLLYVSSGEVYGQGSGEPFDESYSGYVDCTSLRSCYPSAKRAAESLCVAYTAQYGVETVIVRPCHTFGPHFSDNDNRAYAQFIKNVVNDENIVLKSSGLQTRSWCYVVDCASAILTVLIRGCSSEAYNISDSSSCATIKEVADIIANYAGKRVVFETPSSQESSGYNVVTKSILLNDKLKSLGWTSLFSLRYGLEQSVKERLDK